jgi:hypothetical protein
MENGLHRFFEILMLLIKVEILAKKYSLVEYRVGPVLVTTPLRMLAD